MSVVAIVLVGVIVVACIGIYIFMSISPAKKVIVDDSAEIFTEEDEAYIEQLCSSLSKDKDINVLVVTTRDKGTGYSNSDEDCARFAGDYYAEHAISTRFQNNSGVCILIDLTLDYSGGRFFWLYTYGTAYYAIDNNEAYNIFYNYKDMLSVGDYTDAVCGILTTLTQYDYQSVGIVTFFTVILPAGISALFAKFGIRKGKLKKTVTSRNFLTMQESDPTDTFVRKSVRVVSSGGSGGGGGGFGGGGGGGGHSGGGGGRF